jgi:hypothetical protein
MATSNTKKPLTHTEIGMKYYDNQELTFEYEGGTLSIKGDIDWFGSARNSDAYLKSVNGLGPEKLTRDAKAEFEYAFLHEFGKHKEEKAEMQAEERGDEERGN